MRNWILTVLLHCNSDTKVAIEYLITGERVIRSFLQFPPGRKSYGPEANWGKP